MSKLFDLIRHHSGSQSVLATIHAPISDEKSWVAFLPGTCPKWTFRRYQIPPAPGPNGLVFNLPYSGLYEHRNTSQGSGFIYLHSNGMAEHLSQQEAIDLLS